ncbi:15-hydroxyprostaglandin dehydrogenase [NAD(+)]-like [Microplitis mediator]|uniref:15-hydroxyprostaglandin dehydrogenase [NAD(+)]-like n=1 Tax=Microplitis mediator TaxID=375433 RepID=UPI0025531205|nr:15-hydroxyprostaglandin dehydrogenase [NAD(+)]-like [Microplitis mediator]
MADFPDRKSRRASAEEKAKELEIIKGLVCGKNVIITGGASGLGYSFVNHFLEHGAKKVAIIDVDTAAGEQAVRIVTKTYGEEKIIFINADTSNSSQMLDTFTQLSKSMDSIDIVVNNAGILDERRWEKEIAINVTGMLSVATLALQFMGKDQGHNGGVLVNIGQYFDFKTTAQLPVYTATKFAMIGLSQSLGASYHYKRTGVRVMGLCPGLTETALTINSPNRLSSRIMKADFVKNLENLSIQTPYIVAKGLMTILRCGESGSIWVIDNGQTPYEVLTPHYKSLKRCYKNNFIPTFSQPMTKGRPSNELRIYDNNIRTGLTSCA